MNECIRIDDIRPAKGARRKKTRKGRGASSGRGRSCGRGRGGSGHRSGLSRKTSGEGGQMPLVRALPKRGFSNKMFASEYDIVNLCVINERFKSGDAITPEKLKEKGLIKNKRPVKILAKGDIKKKISVSGCLMSAGARSKIEEAGGEIK
jgi:large subunit ribosomal protein L15